jgi:hypothetical protein
LKKTTIAGATFAAVLALLALVAGYRILDRSEERAAATSTTVTPATAASAAENPPSRVTHPAAETHQGFLYGRVTADDGAVYQGRLRWGTDEEAFWSDTFFGSKDGNPWVARVPPGRRPQERRPLTIFGIEIGRRGRGVDLRRQLMVRFGDIARIEGHWPGRDLRVTLKSGAAFGLDRFQASDFDGGVRVWDGRRGVVDLAGRRIRTIELLPTPPLGAAPYRLHGTVRTRQGVFTGFVRWDRDEYLGTDELVGRASDGTLRLRFDTIGAIARRSGDAAQVKLLDGSEIVLAGIFEDGLSDRGVYVDDARYGRVLVSWDVFERVDFSPDGSGPGYEDFPPGRPLTGSVLTRDGRRLAGRLVYDLDESETSETLDAPDQGVTYTIPFGLVAAIVLPSRERGRDDGGPDDGGTQRAGTPRARVALYGGEELQLELAGDLGDRNAGMLIFTEGRERPEYVSWEEVQRIDLDRPPEIYLP